MSMIRKRVVVRGRVQGVFFRDTTRRMAAQQGVAGWVRNREDGAVEDVEVSAEEPEGLSEFRISG